MNLMDIIGPVMVGPSSSHTAGAVRIGGVSRKLLGERVADAKVIPLFILRKYFDELFSNYFYSSRKDILYQRITKPAFYLYSPPLTVLSY